MADFLCRLTPSVALHRVGVAPFPVLVLLVELL